MAKIRTFARIKPSDNLYDDFDTTHNRLYLRIPDSYSRDSTLYNRTRAPIVNHEFKYSQVFPANSTQGEVFDVVAKSIIDGFLEGYNGTIFAYGQTSSGKTHTMQGNLNDREQRGLAPRSLTRIFAAVNARKEAGENITVHGSFLEIYQEVGYDLLKPTAKSPNGTTGFSKVTVVDGPQGAAVVKNLSILSMNSEEVAQSLLAQGELNRKVAETAMNNRSSRSHAVFTVYLSSRKGDMLVRSKMHFVDLAGSERVCKTGVKGLQLSEAKYINLSLHYLEGVIIALHQDATSTARLRTAPLGVSKSWSALAKRPYSAADSSGRHIPYRNSLLTMLLKDSLGGNCLTTMIATISLELANLSESISTCRFAQRVSCISNTARKNEEIDDKSMIKKLRTRVAELEVENNMLKHGGPNPSDLEDEKQLLTKEDREFCQHIVKDFLNGRLVDPIVAGVTDPHKFRECMSIFKKLIKENSDKTLRIAEQLKRQPSHVQEAFYTGGRYHEAPLAYPSKRQNINFRDDANDLAKNAYGAWERKQQRSKSTSFRPTILKPSGSSEGQPGNSPAEAWQSRLHDEGRPMKKKQVRIVLVEQPAVSRPQEEKPKPKSAGAAFLRIATPFDRKRNQEVVQLNKKVESNYAEQLEQTNHLKAFKKSVAEQEFEMAIHSLGRKLEVTQHQLADQHAYTVKLQQQGNDKQLIEQETLVKRQLQKRVDRLHTEVSAAKARLAEIQSQNDEHVEEQPAQYRTVKDKFSAMTRKDGSLDAVKVKTTLQQQEKLQNKLQKKIDRQRALAIDKHLEIQELSTRQKLEEFKRKLANSQQGSRNDNNKTSSLSSTSQTSTGNQLGTQVSMSVTSPTTESTQTKPDSKYTESFQSRIQQENSSQENNIHSILSKYRTGTKTVSTEAHANQRTAQVDQILAKYKRGSDQGNRVSEQQTSATKTSPPSHSTRANTHNLRNRTTSISAQLGGTRDRPKSSNNMKHGRSAVVHTRIKVPNSEMEYRVPVINTANQKSGAQVGSPPRQEFSTTRAANSNMPRYDDFQATLKTMLEHRQGNHKRRTDAWTKTAAAPKQSDKQSKHAFLAKQAKNKSLQTNGQLQDKSKQQATSRTPNGQISPDKRSDTSSLAKERNKTFLTNNREFSHRISSYHTNPTQVTHHDNNQDINDCENAIDKEATEEIKIAEAPTTPPKVYSNLKKLSQRNERTNQIRRIQTAAVKIQRMWRRHHYK